MPSWALIPLLALALFSSYMAGISYQGLQYSRTLLKVIRKFNPKDHSVDYCQGFLDAFQQLRGKEL